MQVTAKAMPTHTPRTWLLSLCLVAGASSLTGCDLFTDDPKPEQKIFFMGRFCDLAETGPMQRLPNNERGNQRVAYDISVDCMPKGGQLVRRIEGTLVFQHAGPSNIMSGLPWNADEMTLRDSPPPASMGSGPSASPPAGNRYSDGPECNAMTQRMAEQVLPCLQAQNTEAASQIQKYLQQDAPGLLNARNPSSLAVALMLKDEQCLYRWRQINMRLMELPTAAACAIPP